MNANIFIAEHVTFHDDGTFSLLRGGIDQFRGKPGEQIPISGRLFVMIHADRHETGDHEFKLSVIDLDGNRVVPDIEGEFHVPEGGGRSKFQVPFQFAIDDPGSYEFGFSINGDIKSRWGFEIQAKQQSDSEGA
jgi:hypothetical protein